MKIILLISITIISLVYVICLPNTKYLDLKKFSKSVDESVGCLNYKPTLEDINISTNKDNILSLTANYLNKPGLFIDAIAHYHPKWKDNSKYSLSGEFRKVSGHPEQIDINLQYVSNYTERRAELIVSYNPFSSLYGWLWTRSQEDTPIKLIYVGDNTSWHKFTINTYYSTKLNQYIFEEIIFDSIKYPLNFQMGTLEKTYEKDFSVSLETHNQYTNCDSNNIFVGISEWKNITLSQYYLKDN